MPQKAHGRDILERGMKYGVPKQWPSGSCWIIDESDDRFTKLDEELKLMFIGLWRWERTIADFPMEIENSIPFVEVSPNVQSMQQALNVALRYKRVLNCYVIARQYFWKKIRTTHPIFSGEKLAVFVNHKGDCFIGSYHLQEVLQNESKDQLVFQKDDWPQP